MGKKIYFFLLFFILILFSLFLTWKNRETAKSSLVSAEGRLVDGGPQFPVIPGAVVEKSSKKLEQDKRGYEAVYEINIQPQAAIQWYHTELVKEGWEIYDEVLDNIVTDLFIRAKRGDELINVFSETEDGRTEVTIEFPVQ